MNKHLHKQLYSCSGNQNSRVGLILAQCVCFLVQFKLPFSNRRTATLYRADGCYLNLLESDMCRGNTAVTLKTHTNSLVCTHVCARTHTHTHTHTPAEVESTYITASALTFVLNVISSEGYSFLTVKPAKTQTHRSSKDDP